MGAGGSGEEGMVSETGGDSEGDSAIASAPIGTTAAASSMDGEGGLEERLRRSTKAMRTIATARITTSRIHQGNGVGTEFFDAGGVTWTGTLELTAVTPLESLTHTLNSKLPEWGRRSLHEAASGP
jgi:hypothetical protein